MNKKIGLIALFCIFIAGAVDQPLLAQTDPNVRYIHDEAGSLIGSVDANGNAKIYNFDAAGNLVSIERLTASGPVDVFFVEPNRGTPGVRSGTVATIHGIGFSDVTAQNQVTFFNGVAAVAEQSTNFMIRARVPVGARTGPVQVTVQGVGTATSRNDFRIDSCIAPLAGLARWWPGDGDARELIGANHGRRQGTATFVPGLVSHAFSFDGARGAVAINNHPVLNPQGASFTVEFWIKTDSAGFFRAIMNKREDCGSLRSFWDIRLSANGYIEAALESGGAIYAMDGKIPVNDGNWHQIALVRQGATATLYIDAQARGSVDTKEVLNINNTAPLLFGNDPCVGADGTRFYQGLIDEVNWFNRALSPAEIQSIFNAGESGMCKEQ